MVEASSDTAPTPSQSKSLLKRLAGPSSAKAGLTNDQSDINRIIAEASKGSKYYENEKKKDKELTERIKRLLQTQNTAMKEADLAQVESTVSHVLIELESLRDTSQIIVHIDADAFFANCELLYNPDLKGKPFGVGKGVLTTASYEARKFGVRSGMAAFIAKKLCPELILLSIHPQRYSDMSKKVMAILARYDPDMLVASCDEAYLNITEYCEQHNVTAEECVSEMRRIVQEETKLTVSAGIAPNRMLAKICSDKNKPNGQFHLPFNSQAIKDFMVDLPVRKVPGIGRVLERMLESIGVTTCGDIFTHRVSIALLDKEFGLRFMLQTYMGIASNVVRPYSREERKSIGAERTFHPLADKDKILQKLEEVAEELENDMTETGWAGRTVTLKYKLDDYQVFTRAKSFERWITKKVDLFATGKELLLPELPLKIRLIGLRVTKLKDLKLSTDSGIKRYFSGPTEQTSPRKKRKISSENNQDVDYNWQDCILLDGDEEDCKTLEDELLSLTKPASPRASAAPEGAVPTHESKPVSAKAAGKKRSIESQISCPLCGKELNTNDNQKVNAHIDFCLSREAIQEADGQLPDAKAKSKSQANAWSWFLDPKTKPRSKGK
ncbi:IMS-domain-containing protein [Lentinula aff. detonsa]|uniref:DNA polymerase kappa n=1 Tax=Lentinula aff. detonsa TaxID=2804958 RepID=A0AA38NU25_9AGAR|nr:IMS-domain-containing protein [Lentinula aff. detonsa]